MGFDRTAKNTIHDLGNLMREQWRNGISYLMILLRTIALKKIVIRESLKPGGLTYGKATTLLRIRMDKIVAVL